MGQHRPLNAAAKSAQDVIAELTNQLTEAREYIAIAFHPEIGWAVDPDRHQRIVDEVLSLRTEMRSILHMLPISKRELLKDKFDLIEKAPFRPTELTQHPD